MKTTPRKLTVLLLLLGLALASALTETMPATAQNSRQTIIADDDGPKRYHQWKNGRHSLTIELEGEVAFTDDDAGIQSVSRGGYLEIEEDDGSRERRLEVKPTADGGVTYAYYVEGRRQDFDAEGADWLAGLLPRIIRNTGIGAEARVERLLESGGPEAVLDEIDLIESSSAKRIYASYLVEKADLSTRDLERLAREVAQIASSGEKARFLIQTADAYVGDPATYEAYFDAVSAIESSGDHTRVLLNLAQRPDPGTPLLVRVLHSARGIASSGDRARLLMEAAPHYVGDPEMRAAYFEAVRGIPSSGDHTRVLLALLEEADALDEATVAALFNSAGEIASSGDKARLLTAAAPRYATTPAHRQAYFGAVESIPSSGDHARVLLALLDQPELDKASTIAVLASARQISSSGDKTRVLLGASERVAGDDELVDAYLETAETIGSSNDRSRALTALLKAGEQPD